MHTFICLLIIILTTSVSAEDGVCREGWYGKSCDLKCSNSCRPLETYPCNKETGRCSEGCKIGYYGINCEKKCNCTGSCIQETGACIGDNPTRINSQDNQDNQNNQDNQDNQDNQQKNVSQGNSDGWRNTAIVFIILFFVVLILIMVAVLRSRRPRLFRKRNKSSGDEMKSFIKTKQRQSIEKGPNKIDDDEVQRLKNERTRIIAAYNRILEHNGLLPDSTFYHLGKNRFFKDMWLQCPTLDCIVQTYTEGHGNLANKKDSEAIKDDHQNLRNCVTITNGIKHTGFPQYFELVFHINIDEPLEETKCCLEIKIYSGENKGKANNICLRLGICSKCPKPYMCLLISQDGKNSHHQRTMVQNNKGCTEIMKLSAMFNNNKLCFFETGKVHICTLNLSLEKSNWSISGESIETCTVEFVSGFDIEMTSEMLKIIKPYAG